jgi:hypothetical protein
MAPDEQKNISIKSNREKCTKILGKKYTGSKF